MKQNQTFKNKEQGENEKGGMIVCCLIKELVLKQDTVASASNPSTRETKTEGTDV